MTALSRAAAAVTVAALAAPAYAAPVPPPPPTVSVAEDGPRQVAKRLWRAQTKAQHQYHCRHYQARPKTYGRGFRYGARLDGASARQARALWRGWRWQLERKCPA